MSTTCTIEQNFGNLVKDEKLKPEFPKQKTVYLNHLICDIHKFLSLQVKTTPSCQLVSHS